MLVELVAVAKLSVTLAANTQGLVVRDIVSTKLTQTMKHLVTVVHFTSVQIMRRLFVEGKAFPQDFLPLVSTAVLVVHPLHVRVNVVLC